MSKNRKQQKKLNNTNNFDNISKKLRLVLLFALVITIFYPPYLRGLYFETEQLPTEIIVFSIFALFWVYKWMKKDSTFLNTPIEYAAFGFVLVYFISIFVAVSTRAAIGEWLKYCMYFAVFYMVTELADTYKSRLMVIWTMIASGVGVCIIGLDSGAGNRLVDVLNGIFNKLGVNHDLFFGLLVWNRINSTLQYPNALAAYVMALFFACIGLLMAVDKIWFRAIAGISSFILFATFILTQSRGAQLLFPAACIIFVLAMPKGDKIKGAAYLLSMSVPSGIIAFIMSPLLSETGENGGKVWMYILTGSILLAGIGVIAKYIANVTQKINWKIYVGGIVGIVVVLIVMFVYVMNAAVPLELAHSKEEKDSSKAVTKNISLKPDKEYILSYEIEAAMENEKQPYAYNISISSRSEKNILFDGSTEVYKDNYKNTNGTEKREINFTIPVDSKSVSISFVNYYAGTKAIISKASILDAESGKTVKNLVLKNKYNIINKYFKRFENLESTQNALVRMIYYKDGLKMFKDRWFLGAGGGAWPYIYFSYQSYLYWSNQAHNYPLQVAIESGIVGLLVLLALAVSIIWMFIAYRKGKKDKDLENSESRVQNLEPIVPAIFTAIVFMLMHSVMDFDLSLSSVMLILWQLIALLNSFIRKDVSGSWFLDIGKKSKKFVESKQKPTAVIVLIITLIIIIIPIRFNVAYGFGNKALYALKENNIDLAIVNMEKAIKADSFKAEYKIGYQPISNRSDILIGYADLAKRKIMSIQSDDAEAVKKQEIQSLLKAASEYVKKAEVQSKYAAFLNTDIGSFYIFTGNFDKGLEFIERGQKLRPLRPEEWQQRVDAYTQMMNYYLSKDDNDNALKMIDRILGVADEADEVNKNNLNPFTFTEKTLELIENAKNIKDQLKE